MFLEVALSFVPSISLTTFPGQQEQTLFIAFYLISGSLILEDVVCTHSFRILSPWVKGTPNYVISLSNLKVQLYIEIYHGTMLK